MAKFRSITPLFSVAGQISTLDIVNARLQGFTTVLNSRPDHEDGVQFHSNEAVSVAMQNDLEYAYVPAENHLIYRDRAIEEFIDALSQRPGPVLAYCKSGTRCAILWALAAARFAPAAEVLAYLEAQGFDEFDILEADMAEQSARFLAANRRDAIVPAIFRLPETDGTAEINADADTNTDADADADANEGNGFLRAV